MTDHVQVEPSTQSDAAECAERKRCAHYARSATGPQDGAAIQDQLTLLRERSAALGWQEVGEYVDAVFSGMTTKRASLQRLIADAKAGRFEFILVEGIDRISRSAVDAHFFFELMEFHGVKIYSLADSGFIGPIHFAFHGFQHRQFISDVSCVVRRGMIDAVQRGRLVGPCSYGYRPARPVDAAHGVWDIDWGQAHTVRRVFSDLEAGKSAREIAAALNAEDVRTVRQGKWTAGHIERIARNPIYRGVYVWGATRKLCNPETGKAVSKVATEKDRVVVERPHLRIVDDATWYAVQQRLSRGGFLR